MLAPDVVSLARQLGPERCRSTAECFELTRDAADAVRLMIEYLRQPELLDEEHVAPWRSAAAPDAPLSG
jgi:hypothetical protein